MRDTLFKSQEMMPAGARDEMDTPVRVSQTPRNGKAGAQSTERIAPHEMNVENCCRPRRGHDY